MVTRKPFGRLGRRTVYAYTIENDRGVSVTVLDYGATLQSVVVPNGGERVDVLLGYDSLSGYRRGGCYLGASIGRFAGRIPEAVLHLGDETFALTENERGNQLHGGLRGFDKHVWDANVGDDSVTFSLVSPSGDEGYPGTLRCTAAYALCGCDLTVTYTGVSDRMTAWNPTNHGYWNLNGHDAGDARTHLLELPADRYVPVGPDMLPAGAEADVSGTRFDFRALRRIDGAYDNSFVLSGGPIRLFGARGIGMEITTDCTAVQFYNAEFLSGPRGKDGAAYRPFGAVCLETQGRQTMRDGSVCPENILTPGKEKTRTAQFRFLYKED